MWRLRGSFNETLVFFAVSSFQISLAVKVFPKVVSALVQTLKTAEIHLRY